MESDVEALGRLSTNDLDGKLLEELLNKMKGFLIKSTCLVLLMVTVEKTESREPVLHRVGGGRFSWKPNVNFTDWAIHEQFFVGDWLYFGFNKQLYSVLQVNQTSYDNCIEQDSIKNITKGGRDVFNLTEAKPYYFISGGGHCSMGGMKVALIVQDYISVPSPLTNASFPITVSSASEFPEKLYHFVLAAVFLACVML
ncbi:lamin-like protein [Hibiscus syriacus]|uniref:lamin-like protein n=1 Tax=Hibiscus syriacus TaxID=106335 RepID=UPI001924012E|nr:lamin-like protein [Hibiscus syriacus]